MVADLRPMTTTTSVAMSLILILVAAAQTHAATTVVWEDQFDSIDPGWAIPAGMTMTSQANVTAVDGFEAKVTNTTGLTDYNILSAAPSFFIQPGDTLEYAVRTDPLIDIAADYLELIANDGTSAAVSPFTVHDSGSSYTVIQLPVTKDVAGTNNIWLGNNGFSGAGNNSTFYVDYIKVLRDDPVFASNVVAFDDFQRTASPSLGTTSFGGFQWVETEGNPVQINGQASISLVNWTGQEQVVAGAPSIAGAQINSRGSATDPTAIIDVGLTDVAVTATLRSSLNVPGNNFFGGVRYRLPVVSAGHASDTAQGYTVELTQGLWAGTQTANTVTLRWKQNEILAVAPTPTALLSDGTDYEVRVEAVGNRHKVFIDGVLVIDFTETTPGRVIPGSVGFGGWYGNWLVDDFLVEDLFTGGIPGDLDGDGFVGIADLNIVLGNWNQNVPPGDPLADPSGDGFVGIEDLNTVLGNWNAGTPPVAGAVPEPATLTLLAMAGSVILIRRRRTAL
jgi:hypothetical protein